MNGETCRRSTNAGTEVLSCPGPDACAFANGACKPYARFNVVIGDDDALGSFVLRTTSYNTIRTLMARMEYFRALSGNLLACMPLELKLRGKSTTMSYHTPIYYVDLVVRSRLPRNSAAVACKIWLHCSRAAILKPRTTRKPSPRHPSPSSSMASWRSSTSPPCCIHSTTGLLQSEGRPPLVSV